MENPTLLIFLKQIAYQNSFKDAVLKSVNSSANLYIRGLTGP